MSEAKIIPAQEVMANYQTEIVYSPDDGGYWVSQFDFDTERSRASVKIFDTEASARKAVKSGKLRWEAWR